MGTKVSPHTTQQNVGHKEEQLTCRPLPLGQRELHYPLPSSTGIVPEDGVERLNLLGDKGGTEAETSPLATAYTGGEGLRKRGLLHGPYEEASGHGTFVHNTGTSGGGTSTPLCETP